MKKERTVNHIMVSVIMAILSIGLLAGCGGNNNQSMQNENESSEMSQAGQQQQQMMGQSSTFTATLSGDNEVPPVTTDATGSITATLMGDSLRVQGQFSGLSSDYTASHIHKAVSGENGGVVQPLSPEINSDNVSGSFDATYMLTASQVAALRADSLYINVHSTDHPGGEIRGQLTAGM